ncbi:MAG: hypothetical protein LBJ94_02990 [Puniceicoccales bacterium]|nr:hypothetical protein [Puniceicoccales bacterium]
MNLPMRMDSGQVFQYQRYKPKYCKFNDLQRSPFAPVTLAEMESGQISQYQRYKPRCCKFNDPIRANFRRARNAGGELGR